MGDNILLRLRYQSSEYLEIVVHDPDQSSLLDIYIDLLEGAAKIGMILPKAPTLWYAHNGKNFQLKSESDLMKMFNSFHSKKLINLAIGSAQSPCETVELAYGLIESKRHMENSSTPRESHGTTSLTVGEQNASMNLQPQQFCRRVPPTSARRRGTYVPKDDQVAGVVQDNEVESIDVQDDEVFGVVHDKEVADTDVQEDEVVEVVQDNEVTSTNVQDDEVSDVGRDKEVVGTDLSDDEVAGNVQDNEGADANVQDDEVADVVQDDVNANIEDYFERLYHNGEFYEDQDFGKINLKEWMIFMDKNHLLDVLKDYCVQDGFAIVVLKNERNRYTAVCANSNCGWRIHSSMMADGSTWAIKSLASPHTCMRLNKHNSMATPEWAARKIIQDVLANESISGSSINKLLFERFGINLNTTSLYKAKKIAEKIIHGDEDSSYGSLPGYCEVLKVDYPDSKAHCVWVISKNNPEKPILFKSIFISLKPMIDGFILGCRGLIGVDGCHLKGKYGGVVLSAVALDGNNMIFPIAYGIYENESKSTWSSFFYHLKELLANTDRDNWCIISDRQKGVEPALEEVWPTTSRRFCCTHLCANFKKYYPGQLMHDLFWACCKSYSEFKFIKAMKNIQLAAGLGAVRWLQGVGNMQCWARHKYDPSLHSPETTSNFVESFNSTLGGDRCLPVLTLLEGIRRTCMAIHCERQEEVRNLPINGITTEAQSLLDVALTESRKLEARKASEYEYEVKEGKSSLPVNVSNRTCACGEWQISGIPCRHAMRVITEIRGHAQLYVSHWYSTEMLRRTYSVNYKAIADEEQWPDFDFPKISPPTMKRGVGRPPRNRKRQTGQKEKGLRSRTVRCGKCKEFGHNSLTCKGGLTARERKEQLGIHVQTRPKRKRKVTTTEDELPFVDEVMGSAPWIPESQK